MKNSAEYRTDEAGKAMTEDIVYNKKELPHEGVLSYAMKEKKTRKKIHTSKMFYESNMDQAFYEMCVFE